MRLWHLVEKSLAQRKLSSLLTALSVALGVMLVSAILVLRAEMQDRYLKQGAGFSIVAGPPRASDLGVVLNAIYHVGQSPGLMSFKTYDEFASEKWRRYVRLCVPYAVGDSFRGYRVVATTDGVFSKYFPYPRGDTAEAKLASGRPFRFDPLHLKDALQHLVEGNVHNHDHEHGEEIFEAVVGWEVAQKLGIELGTKIEPTHGVEGEAAHEHEHLWDVVGIFKRTGTPVDRVVFINMDSFYRIGDHAGALIPTTGEPALSSLLIFPRPGYAKAYLLGQLSKRGDLVVAEVAKEVRKLLDIVGNVDEVFFVVCVLVVVIGIVSIMVSIYNTMNERRRELAILRAIGARRSTVVWSIVGEAAVLSFIGGVVGLLLGHGLLWAVDERIAEASGFLPDPWRVLPEELVVVGLVTLAGALAGLIPAWKAYRVDVAKNLAPLS